MAREPPKCCCCVPLRPGLLAWAYTRLVLVFISIGVYFYYMGPRLRYLGNYMSKHPSPIAFILEELMPLFVVFLPYLVFTIIFIIGVHRKNSKLLLVFLVYSIFEVILAIGAVGWELYDLLQDLSYYNSQYDSDMYERHVYYRLHSPILYLRVILPVVLNMLLPLYLIVLVKSEVQRLKTASGETRDVLAERLTKDQSRRHYFVDETPDLRKPLFPVEELKRLRQQLGVKDA